MRFLILSLFVACTASKVEERDSGTHTNTDMQPDDSEESNDGGDQGNGEDGGGDSEESSEDCESEFGTIDGKIFFDPDWGSGPEIVPYGRVIATPNEGEPIAISSDEEGRFSATLPADEYQIKAEDENCISEPFSINLEACETETHTLRLIDCALGESDTGIVGDEDDASGGEGEDTSGGEGEDTSGGEAGGEDALDTDFTTSICTSDEPDMFDVSALAWDGDVLVVSVGYGGCEDGRPFIPCWNGEWDRGMPPGAILDLDMVVTDDMTCMMYVMEDIRIDVSSIIDAAEERTEAEPFQIYVGGMSIEYRF